MLTDGYDHLCDAPDHAARDFGLNARDAADFHAYCAKATGPAAAAPDDARAPAGEDR